MARAKIFVFMEDLENWINMRRFGAAPRDLTDEDYTDWRVAIERRKPVLEDQAHVMAALKRHSPVRWWLFKWTTKWVRKRFRKMGLNPDDAGFLLQ